MRIRVTTRDNLFEQRKRKHIERGYRIEDERPIPVNGFCSFVAVREIPGPGHTQRTDRPRTQRKSRSAWR